MNLHAKFLCQAAIEFIQAGKYSAKESAKVLKILMPIKKGK